jgi:hypothetical protein
VLDVLITSGVGPVHHRFAIVVGVESIHFLGVLRRELCLLATAEFGIPSLKSGAEFVI